MRRQPEGGTRKLRPRCHGTCGTETQLRSGESPPSRQCRPTPTVQPGGIPPGNTEGTQPITTAPASGGAAVPVAGVAPKATTAPHYQGSADATSTVTARYLSVRDQAVASGELNEHGRYPVGKYKGETPLTLALHQLALERQANCETGNYPDGL